MKVEILFTVLDRLLKCKFLRDVQQVIYPSSTNQVPSEKPPSTNQVLSENEFLISHNKLLIEI